MTDPEMRLLQWIKDYGPEKQSVFIADLKAVLGEIKDLREEQHKRELTLLETMRILNEIDRRLMERTQERDAAREEVKKLQEMVNGLADRIAKQSELLTRKAGKVKAENLTTMQIDLGRMDFMRLMYEYRQAGHFPQSKDQLDLSEAIAREVERRQDLLKQVMGGI